MRGKTAMQKQVYMYSSRFSPGNIGHIVKSPGGKGEGGFYYIAIFPVGNSTM